jgi:hypothetical protein
MESVLCIKMNGTTKNDKIKESEGKNKRCYSHILNNRIRKT